MKKAEPEMNDKNSKLQNAAAEKKKIPYTMVMDKDLIEKLEEYSCEVRKITGKRLSPSAIIRASLRHFFSRDIKIRDDMNEDMLFRVLQVFKRKPIEQINT